MAGFHDIIGHDDIIRHLKNAIETGKVSHSYIFTGEPGSGKKLLAGTFAAALQCESGESEPCMTCDSCKKVIGKNHPDIITVTHEKPGSISIDEVRDQVVRDVDIKPYCSPYKIYIIPDAEMMTVQAQNAILKTIEEPPEYAVIMLLTSNIDSLLPTIRSRCVRLDLKVVDDSLVKEYLMEHEDASVLRKISDLTAKDVFDAAKAGDELALEIVDTQARILGRALAQIACVVDPEIFVIGGGVSKAGSILTDSVKKYFEHYAFHACRQTKFALAQLGNDAGIYGSAFSILGR